MKYLLYLVVFGFISSCGHPTFDRKEDMISYIENPDNGFRYEKTIKDFQVSIIHRPSDLLAEQSIRGIKDQKKIDSVRNQFQDQLYLKFSIQKDNKDLLSALPKSNAELSSLVNQLSFVVEDRIHLINNNNDTIPHIDYNYSRMFGMNSSSTFLMVYPRNEDLIVSSSLKLVIEDLGWGFGEVQFRNIIKQKENEPKLIL